MFSFARMEQLYYVSMRGYDHPSPGGEKRGSEGRWKWRMPKEKLNIVDSIGK